MAPAERRSRLRIRDWRCRGKSRLRTSGSSPSRAKRAASRSCAASCVDDHDGLVDKFVGDAEVAVGVGVHTGVSFVGTVGEGDAVDFTALGDTVSATARIASMAGAGELLVSEMTADAAGLDTSGLERRTLELRGREKPVDVWVAAAGEPVAATT